MDTFPKTVSNLPFFNMEKNFLCKDCGKSFLTLSKPYTNTIARMSLVSATSVANTLIQKSSLQTTVGKHMLARKKVTCVTLKVMLVIRKDMSRKFMKMMMI